MSFSHSRLYRPATITTATVVVDAFVNSLDKKSTIVLHSVDLSKASLAVNYNILLNKLLSVEFDDSA